MAAADRETAAEAGDDVAKRPVSTMTTEQGCQVSSPVQEKVKLKEINAYITCFLCKGYLIDATTISECLHSFCRSCIIEFLQENSHCPVCEVIINKAKPNLKLDKTMQDIVYKLVPQLFLNEMTRRKKFYSGHPEVAAKASPEDRGEDIERTIFNPQDVISLSIEYIRDDSTPGAIRLPNTTLNNNNNNNEDTKSSKMDLDENSDSQMKRYLQCPGMCRVEVLKKFVRNKYSVDTSKFHIDILYKRVPLPDHYTLIDIAYIYSWKRNEPMTFYFRITDIDRVTERFDYFDIQKCKILTELPISNIKNRTVLKSAKKLSKTSQNVNKPSPEVVKTLNNKPEVFKPPTPKPEVFKPPTPKPEVDKSSDNKPEISAKKPEDVKNSSNKPEIVKNSATTKPDVPKSAPNKPEVIKSAETKPEIAKKIVFSTEPSLKTINIKPDVPHNKVTKPEVMIKPATKPETTAIKPASTINFINSVKKPEIVQNKKPEIVHNKKPEIVHNKKPEIVHNTKPEIVNIKKPEIVQVKKPEVVYNKKPEVVNNKKPEVKSNVYTNITLNRTNNVEIITKIQKVPSNKTGNPVMLNILKQTVKKPVVSEKNAANLNNSVPKPKNNVTESDGKPEVIDVDEEKVKFLQNIELKANNTAPSPEVLQNKVYKPEVPIKMTVANKRKNSSPMKNEKNPNKKLKPNPAKIILQSKQLPPNFLNDCKINIPSSLSITLKDASGSENNQLPVVAPPVKNYIEILKLPEEKHTQKTQLPVLKNGKPEVVPDDDRKIDEDISKIALSLTEKIPQSTTVSQTYGVKSNFNLPVKKYPALPAPIPEVPTKNSTGSGEKQSFQKIFEEAVKKAEVPAPAELPACDLGSIATQKRNISDIVSELCKKSKNSEDVSEKIQIPRLPNNRKCAKNVKKIENLQSNSLNLMYSVSVEKNQENINIGPKSPGELSIVLPAEVPEVLKAEVMLKTPVNVVLPPKSPVKNNSPKQSFNIFTSTPHIKIPSPKNISTPKLTPIKPKISPQKNNSPKNNSPKMSPNLSLQSQLLEKYNISNLAQLSATSPQMAVLQHAMLVNHFEMQKRQKWLQNVNQQIAQHGQAQVATPQQFLQLQLNGNAVQKNVVKEN